MLSASQPKKYVKVPAYQGLRCFLPTLTAIYLQDIHTHIVVQIVHVIYADNWIR